MKKQKCAGDSCRNPRPGKKPSGISYGRYCHRCRMRRWREKQPMRAAFRNLRDHAIARGIEFALTFEEFRVFAEHSDYLNRTGNESGCLTVDRKDNLRGYVVDNIQPMTRSENSVKRAKYDAIRMRCGYRWAASFDRSERDFISGREPSPEPSSEVAA
jgi:hypothetical protein